MKHLRPHFPFALAGFVWLVLVAIGFQLLWKHESTAGPIGETSSAWPAGAATTHDRKLPTLLVFAHPRCPCTRATLDELAVIMTACHDQVRTEVYLYEMPGDDAQTSATSLHEKASRIPGVHVIADPQGRHAEQFGAQTSGHAFLYDARGKLLFQGGITGSRGHSGSNTGRNAIVDLIHNTASNANHTPVFGCGLTGRHASAQGELDE